MDLMDEKDLPINIDDLFDPGQAERIRGRQEAEAAQRQLLLRLRSVRDRIVAIRPVNLHGVLIRDPAWAAIGADRHERLNIAEQVVTVGTSGSVDAKRRMERQIATGGGFFEHYTVDFVRSRILQVADPKKGGWVIAAARGNPTSHDFSLAGEVEGGDIHLFVPPDDDTVPLEPSIAFDEKRGDIVYPRGREVAECVARHPATAAWISDVCSERAIPGPVFQATGFASTASETAFVEAESLSLDRDVPLQWALAAIANVTHILDQNRQVVAALDPSWLNQRSLDLHTRYRYRSGSLMRMMILGEQVGREIQVNMQDGRVFYLRINWNIAAQELRTPERPVQVTVPDGVPQMVDG